jgi:hypothetical protein
MLERWRAWIAAFDAAAEDDGWSRLEPFLADDVVYAVSGVPFACELRGRGAVIAGFAKSVRNFDRCFGERRWYGVGLRIREPGAITGRAMGVYRLGSLPELTFSAQSLWAFRGDRLSLMTDAYDSEEVDVLSALEWLGRHGEGLDPSYV